jgi:ubiquinol-cytochrome c reductase iron-sulfur subunit
MGIIGAAVGTIPFIGSMWPSERAKARGGPTVADTSKLEPGQQLTVVWRGKPIWILHRDSQILENLGSPNLVSRLLDPNSAVESQQPEYASNPFRSIQPQYFVTISLCTHLGCVPKVQAEGASGAMNDWKGGYYCQCHGSRFDFAGRVYKNVPAPSNLVIPPHRYLSETLIEIGSHTTQEL